MKLKIQKVYKNQCEAKRDFRFRFYAGLTLCGVIHFVHLLQEQPSSRVILANYWTTRYVCNRKKEFNKEFMPAVVEQFSRKFSLFSIQSHSTSVKETKINYHKAVICAIHFIFNNYLNFSSLNEFLICLLNAFWFCDFIKQVPIKNCADAKSLFENK